MESFLSRIHTLTLFVLALLVCSFHFAWGQADNYGEDQVKRKAGADDAMHFVLVSKSHFDIGYSALAKEVEHEYRTTMIDRALRTMEENAKVAAPGEDFVWTVPGWPMHTILWEGQNPKRRARIEEAWIVETLAIHAYVALGLTGNTSAGVVGTHALAVAELSRRALTGVTERYAGAVDTVLFAAIETIARVT